MKKLIKLDENLRLTEIDWKAARHQAKILCEYIENAPEAERAKYQYDSRAMPLIDAVMNGSMEIPYLDEDPYNYRSMTEGWLPFDEIPDMFSSIYSKFYLMIGASSSMFSLSTHESGKYIFEKYRVEKDGELYEWCWFED